MAPKGDIVKEETEKSKEDASNVKDVNRFDKLVEINKLSGKYWYYGLKGKWWWGMSEKQVRKKIEEGKIGILGSRQMIALVSIIRNEEHNGNLGRFLSCCNELEKYHDLVYIFIEGDSSDKTYDTLRDWLVQKKNYILKKIDRRHRPFHKNKDRKRTVYFAELRNILIDSILSIREISEIFMIDANYRWKGDIITSLRDINADIAAPLAVSYKDNDGKYFFYDTWAFRKDGREFVRNYPYVEGFDSKKPMRIDSVGGGYLIKRKVLEAKVRYDGRKDCEHIYFCQRAKKKGFSIKISPKIMIKKGVYKK